MNKNADRYLLLIDSPQELGERFKVERNKLGKTQEDVSNILGVSAAALSRMESGKYLPSDKLIRKIAEIYGMPPEMLSHVGAAIKRGQKPLDLFTGMATEIIGVSAVTKIPGDDTLDAVGKLKNLLGQLDSKVEESKVRNR